MSEQEAVISKWWDNLNTSKLGKLPVEILAKEFVSIGLESEYSSAKNHMDKQFNYTKFIDKE